MGNHPSQQTRKNDHSCSDTKTEHNHPHLKTKDTRYSMNSWESFLIFGSVRCSYQLIENPS